MPLGMPVMRKLAPVGRYGEVVELFGELGVAEQEAKRGAEVVELFGGDALGLGVAGGVEPGEFAVEDEDLAVRAGRRVQRMRPGFLSRSVPDFGALHAHAGVTLGVAGA